MMSNDNNKTKNVKCSFCGKSQENVKKIRAEERRVGKECM